MKHTKKIVGSTATILAACAMFIAPHEGLRVHAYRDPVGIPTICSGETAGVQMGQTYTKEQCLQMLQGSIPKYLEAVDKTLPGLPNNRRIAYTDFAYNGGIGLFSKSRIPVLEKAGKWQEACSTLKKYVYAKGQVLPGLVTRRNDEYEICMGG